jgi:hypothetical protein
MSPPQPARSVDAGERIGKFLVARCFRKPVPCPGHPLPSSSISLNNVFWSHGDIVSGGTLAEGSGNAEIGMGNVECGSEGIWFE